MYMNCVCVCSAYRGSRGALEFVELKLKVVVSLHLNKGNMSDSLIYGFSSPTTQKSIGEDIVCRPLELNFAFL